MRVHYALISFCKYQTDNSNFSVHLNNQNIRVIKTFLTVWPLKKGSVGANYLPWNEHNLSKDCVNFCVAFILKCFFVLEDKNLYLEDVKLLKNISDNNQFCVYLWDSDLSNPADDLMKKKIKANIPVILCLSNVLLTSRAKANQELEKFEYLLEYLIRNGNSLIVFSEQKLCSAASPFMLHSGHSMADIKELFQADYKPSIEEALEPSIFDKKNQAEDSNKNFSTGSFDRLLELLAMGQDFIFSVESAFIEKIK